MTNDRVIAASNATTYFASGWTVVTSLLWDNIATVVGIIVALGGLIVSTYFQFKKDRREAAESKARIQLLRAKTDAATIMPTGNTLQELVEEDYLNAHSRVSDEEVRLLKQEIKNARARR